MNKCTHTIILLFLSFIFCFFSVAILATTTLPNAYAGPYDKEIEDLQKQIDELNSDIDKVEDDIQTEKNKIIDFQNELLEIDETIAETEALINSNDPQIKELVKNSQLEKKLKELTTPNGKDLTPLQRLIQAEEFLTELVDKTSNPDTIQLHKKVEKVGFENLTPKEKIRYYNGVKLMEDLNIEKEGEEFSKTQAGIAAEALSNK